MELTFGKDSKYYKATIRELKGGSVANSFETRANQKYRELYQDYKRLTAGLKPDEKPSALAVSVAAEMEQLQVDIKETKAVYDLIRKLKIAYMTTVDEFESFKKEKIFEESNYEEQRN